MTNSSEHPVHLFAPPSLRRYAPKRFVPGPGMRHVALEYDLVEALRPALVVDLGAGDCASFFAYCQSMLEHDVDGSCYAIDHWPEAEGETFDAVSAHGRAAYAGISYFVRMAPADAKRHFEDDSIDLLRFDGTRPDVIGEDVDQWFRRVRPGGIVLWHGATVEPKGFSWLAARCRAVVFSEGRGGLGVARKDGPPPAAELTRLLFCDDEGPDLERFYKHIHEHLAFARLLAAGLKAT